jgi:hypothetical protein
MTSVSPYLRPHHIIGSKHEGTERHLIYTLPQNRISLMYGQCGAFFSDVARITGDDPHPTHRMSTFLPRSEQWP